MKVLVQTTYAEPDSELTDPLIIHRRAESSRNETLIVFIHGLGGRRYGPKIISLPIIANTAIFWREGPTQAR